MMAVLALVRELELPDWFVGAGAVRDLVWDVRFGAGFEPARVEDIDVVYFDPDDLAHEAELAVEARLQASRPELEWDAKNQARVHLWYPERFGEEVEPLPSTEAGIATWPETATCVGVRLEPDDHLTITAPHGLEDLLDGLWRLNPVRVTEEEAERRFARKDPIRRWRVQRRASR
jgi:hypothetical protein